MNVCDHACQHSAIHTLEVQVDALGAVEGLALADDHSGVHYTEHNELNNG